MERNLRIALICLYIAVSAALSACAGTTAELAAQDRPRVPNEYLVTLAPNVDENVITQYYGRFGIKYVHALQEETYLLVLSDDPGPRKLESLIANEPGIRVVQPNLIRWNYH